ncbi:MAG: GvpL/GvpF family gas vesicle protein [Candidatus Spechtbacterales bacterium]
MDETKGKYIYCIIKEKRPLRFGILGQEGKEVYSVVDGEFAAVVSDSEIKDFPFTREYLMAHQKAIEEVMKKGYDVLPVRFGTVAENGAALHLREKILRAKKKELQDAFTAVEGKVELGLRALWENMKDVFAELVLEHSDIQKAKKEAEKSPNQFKVARVGELLARALAQKREQEATKILRPLKKLSADFRERDRMGDSMILSAAFLVPKKNEKEFDTQVSLLRNSYGARVRFLYVGPIPPFNFVELKLAI